MCDRLRRRRVRKPAPIRRATLEMHGDWALQLNLSGPLRDRVVTTLRFDPDKVAPATKAAPPHKH